VSPLLFALAMILFSSRMTDETSPFADRAARCIAVACVLTLPPVAALGVIFRRAFVTASAWRVAALGVACGALGASTMGVACIHSEAMHVVVAHGSMIIVGGIAGAWIGRFVARA
jgi:hypothetical protein